MTRLVQIGSAGDRSLPGADALRGVVPAAAVVIEPASVSIRRASFADVETMTALINGYAADGLMLPKTPGQVFRALREFLVAEDAGGTLLGCGALRIYDAGLAEVCSLAVSDAARGLGVGRKIVEALHAEARLFGLPRVFALTLEPRFFHRLGYVTVNREVLPQKIEADCVGCPRRHACNEIAVVRILERDTEGVPQ